MMASPGYVRHSHLLILIGSIVCGILILYPCSIPAEPQHPSDPLQHVVSVINIEVPVRVFAGDLFVDNLMIKDFEVYENGVLQKLEAMYLIKSSALHREEGHTTFAPKTERHFILFFQTYTWNPKIEEGIAYFIRNVLRPEDNLTVVTSVKPYHLKKGDLDKPRQEDMISQLAGLVKRDTLVGNTEYLSILNELKQMLSGGGLDKTGARQPDLTLFGEGTWQEFLMNYRDLRERLEKIRSFDQERLLSFAQYLKKMDGQKNVLLYYEREYMPMVDRKKYIGLFESGEDFLIEQDFKDLFDLYKRDSKIDVDLIKRTFSDASISIHFLYVTSSPEHVGGVSDAAMEEHSEDMYRPFFELAQATGGVAESSTNPSYLMQKAGNASENYYLLYYKPTNATADGKFRNITIKVKDRTFRVLHRAGYFAH